MQVEEILMAMTLPEKIGQLNLINPGGQTLTGSVANDDIERKLLGGEIGMMFGTASLESRIEIQRLCVERTRLKIPMLFASDVIHGYRTALPLPLALSCSWDIGLVQQAAALSAVEARADGIDLTFAPMVDICRDPRWGRVAEGLGESPFLASQMTAAMVHGFQGDGVEDHPDQIDRMLACVKHFAGYGAADGGREYASVQMGPHEMHATHLPPFKAAIDAGVAALMPGFHCLDRIPVTLHRGLLIDVLRRRWQFGGAVISDYTAIAELVDHAIGDENTVTAAAINAGVDVDMVSEFFVQHVQSALAKGLVQQQTIDDACRRVLSLKKRAGLLDDPFRYLNRKRASAIIGCEKHRGQARRIAAECCVLLKNDATGDGRPPLPLHFNASEKNNGTLPFRLALIGPFGEDRRNLAGTWSVSANPEDNVSLLDGLKQWAEQSETAVQIGTAVGSQIVDDAQQAERLNVFGETVTIDETPAGQMIDRAVALAAQSDLVLLAVGEAKEHAGECSSRTDPSIPMCQRRLIDAIAQTGRPTVLIVFAGRPLILTDVADRVDSILYAWYGGVMMGPAIVDVLTGAVNPSARLTMSFPRRVGQIPVHHDALPTGRPIKGAAEFEKFKSCYLDLPNSPLFPFGFGLSYGQVRYDAPVAKQVGDQVEVVVTVTNLSDRVTTEVVQCYATPPPGPTSAPTLMLVAHQKIQLEPGMQQRVTLAIRPRDVTLPVGERIADVEMIHRPGRYRFGVGSHSGSLQWAEMQWQ